MPNVKTPLSLEYHVVSVYTKTIFYDVQYEICPACFGCQVVSVRVCDTLLCYEVDDGQNGVF